VAAALLVPQLTLAAYVVPAPTTTSGLPASAWVVLGQPETDNVTVKGNPAVNGSPTGKVTFAICGPGASDCATGGSLAVGSASLVASGDGVSATSEFAFAPVTPGTWCFRAVYSGDSNYAGSSDGAAHQCFRVLAAPSAIIHSPKDGASYTLGEPVPESFSCSDNFGLGVADCSAPPRVDTNSLGTFAFTVAATSNDGLTTATTVHYHVIRPSNRFSVTHLRPRLNGTVTFTLKIPGGGEFAINETAPRSALPHPRRGRLTFASRKLKALFKSSVRVTVKPNKRGRALLHHHNSTVWLTLAVKFTPINGKPRIETFRRLRVTK
jgi:hypothetical protein